MGLVYLHLLSEGAMRRVEIDEDVFLICMSFFYDAVQLKVLRADVSPDVSCYYGWGGWGARYFTGKHKEEQRHRL